jgi:hypothetical protein
LERLDLPEAGRALEEMIFERALLGLRHFAADVAECAVAVLIALHVFAFH